MYFAHSKALYQFKQFISSRIVAKKCEFHAKIRFLKKVAVAVAKTNSSAKIDVAIAGREIRFLAF